MPDHARRRPDRRWTAGLLAGLLLLPAGGAFAQDGSGSPGDPGTGVPLSPQPSQGPVMFDDSATPVAPMPGAIVDPQPIGWDHVTIWPDGRTLTVYFWNGVEACYGLERIELADVGGTIAITLFTGFREDAANIRCVEMAQLYSTIVTLESPVLGGGVEGLVGEQPIDGAAEVIRPGSVLLEPAMQAWERVQVGPDGESLWVWFSGGVEPCFGLERVAYDEIDGLPTLSLVAGQTDSLAMCIAIVVQHRTPVAVPDPILLGGMA